jgi:hypothetical protein
MATDKYTVEIVDSDGNSSRLVLPGFALDSTQEKLIKSVQALGKMNPKQAEAYEKLLAATTDAAKAGKSASEKQTEELEKVLNVSADKQVKALKSFRGEFADNVGKDMRNTFVAGGNILTAAIKTATVGLAAGAGLLYKTFMDTSEAFRSLAQSGLGGAGASGTEAQDAVGSLVQLGMSASEAASLLTGFGRASAVLGKANFAKFVSGIATSSSFAAELGLTLSDAAEFTANEIDMRQRAMSNRMQLDAFTEISIKENIKLTQAMSSIFGRSMKDIQNAKQDFLTNSAQLATLTLRLPADMQAKAVKEISDVLTIAEGFGGDIANFMKVFINAGASAVPMADSAIQQIMALGSVGTQFRGELTRFNNEIRSGSVDARATMLRLVDMLAQGGEKNARLLSILEASGDPMAAMMARAARDAKVGGQDLRNALMGIVPALDPMITSGTRLENTLSEVSGAFKAFGLQVLGGLAQPLDSFMKALTDTGLTKQQEELAAKSVQQWEKNNALSEDATAAQIEAYNMNRDKIIEEAYTRDGAISVLGTLRKSLNEVGKTVLKVFFGDITPTAENFGKVLRDKLIPFIEETATQFKEYLESLQGKTIGEKLETMLKDVFNNYVVPALVTVLKAAVIGLFTSPEVIAGLLAAFTGLATLSLAKTAATSFFSRTLAGTAATAASGTAATAAGMEMLPATTAGGGLLATARSYGGAFGNTLKALPSAGYAGKAITGASALTAGALVGKDALDIGSSLYKGESAKGADIGGVAGGVLGGVAGALLGGPVGAAIGASLGNMAGEWAGSFFDNDEAESASADIAKQTKEELLQQNGLVAMAIDPEHVKEVGRALAFFNAISVTDIAAGLAVLNPALAQMFETIQNIKTSFVDNVNNRFHRLLEIIKGLNVEGLKLPTTTQYLGELAEKITSMPIDKINKLASAFSSLTTALREFGDLTTSTRFGRMWDAFTGKQDETANIIEVLNNFATEVKSDELLKAAQATMAFNAGMAGYAAVPEQPARTSAAGERSPAEQVNTANRTIQHNNPYDKMSEIATIMRGVLEATNSNTTKLTTIATNTDPKNRKV